MRLQFVVCAASLAMFLSLLLFPSCVSTRSWKFSPIVYPGPPCGWYAANPSGDICNYYDQRGYMRGVIERTKSGGWRVYASMGSSMLALLECDSRREAEKALERALECDSGFVATRRTK